MVFDTTVSLGNLIQIVLIVVAIIGAYFTLKSQVRLQDARLESEREQRQALAIRVDRLERQIESEIEKLGVKLDEGLRRIYDRLDRKADK